MGMGGMPQNMGQMRPNFPQAWAELQCLTRRVGHPAHRWPGVRRSVKLLSAGVWGQPTDVLSGWQWHLALTCPLGSRCWGMFLSNPFRRRLTDSLSSWYCKEGRPFRSFSILFISCPSFLLMTLSMSHTACVSNCEPFQCLKMLDYELCSLDMLSTLLMTFDMSVVVSRFVTAPAVVSVE